MVFCILYFDLVGGIPMSNELTACRVEKALDVGSHLPCILYFARDTGFDTYQYKPDSCDDF